MTCLWRFESFLCYMLKLILSLIEIHSKFSFIEKKVENLRRNNPFLLFCFLLGSLFSPIIPILLGFLIKLFIFKPLPRFDLLFVEILIIFLGLVFYVYYVNLVKIVFFPEKNNSKFSFVIVVTITAGFVIFLVFPEPLILIAHYLSLLL